MSMTLMLKPLSPLWRISHILTILFCHLHMFSRISTDLAVICPNLNGSLAHGIIDHRIRLSIIPPLTLTQVTNSPAMMEVYLYSV